MASSIGASTSSSKDSSGNRSQGHSARDWWDLSEVIRYFRSDPEIAENISEQEFNELFNFDLNFTRTVSKAVEYCDKKTEEQQKKAVEYQEGKKEDKQKEEGMTQGPKPDGDHKSVEADGMKSLK